MEENEQSVKSIDDYKELINKIVYALKVRGTDYETLFDLYNITANMNIAFPGSYDKACRGIFSKIRKSAEYKVVENSKEVKTCLKRLNAISAYRSSRAEKSPEKCEEYKAEIPEVKERLRKFREEVNKWEAFKWEVVRHEARQGDFESFIKYMEKNRKPEEKFYEGVRDYDKRGKPVLKKVVDAIQELFDDKLDELFINMPGRVGKTQIVKFAFCYAGALHGGERSNLYSAYSDKITMGFHTGLMELITDPTYTFWEIFPELRCSTKDGIARANAKDEIIDLVRSKTYPTYTCRSIYGTLNGSCDCDSLGVTDDLLSGYEEAVNPDRLEACWGRYDNNFISRIKMGAKLINMGTRWAINDPQGRRLELLNVSGKANGVRWKQIVIPALDENDNSNFDYNYDKGFDTETYLLRRASFEHNNDMASWNAQYMQRPTDRDAMLFRPQDMRFYDGTLPVGEPDRVIMAGDIAFGGGDYTSVPVCYQFGEAFYIHDVVYSDGEKNVTRPLIVNKAINNKVGRIRLEATKTTEDYVDILREMFKKANYRINIESKAPSSRTSKDERIRNSAPEIREFYFLEDGKRSSEYQKFMESVYSFRLGNRNPKKHDDAPDSLAMVCDAIHMGELAKVDFVDRRKLGF